MDQPNRDTLVVRINGRLFYGQLDINIEGKTLAYDALHKEKGELPNESHVTIQNVNEAEIDGCLAIVNDLCDILTLFTNARYWAFGYRHDKKERSWSVSGGDGRHRILINIDNKSVQDAVTMVWSNYQKYKHDRSLGAIIDYFIAVYYKNPPLEIRLLIVSAMLECLKWSWLETKCDKGLFIKERGKYFLKDVQTGCKVGKQYSFEDSLTEMFSEVGMKCNLSSTKELRNNIVHTGLSGCPIEGRHPTINYTIHEVQGDAVDMMREYVLRLLGYKGQYWKCSNPREIAEIV